MKTDELLILGRSIVSAIQKSSNTNVIVGTLQQQHREHVTWTTYCRDTAHNTMYNTGRPTKTYAVLHKTYNAL